LLEESLSIYQVLGQRRGMAFCLNTMGLVYESLQDFEGARRLYRDSLALFRELDDVWGTAVPLSNLGDVAYTLGAYEEAQLYYYDALKVARSGWAAPKILIHIYQIAATMARLGQAERAVELLVLPLRHPALNQTFKNLAGQLMAELRTSLPAPAITAALEQGQTRTMEQVVAELLSDESSPDYTAVDAPNDTNRQITNSEQTP
jgi:tetratricopeptide (TPR) repeat protein